MDHMHFELEKYKGRDTRHTCPGCGQKRDFTRYINTETGEYLNTSVGICNRSSNCRYHYTPKEFLADNPNNPAIHARRKDRVPAPTRQLVSKGFDYLDRDHVLATLNSYEKNSFVQFLLQLFPEDPVDVQAAVSRYLIGTFEGFSVFPKISQHYNVCNAKLMKFNPGTGKRLKSGYSISTLPYELARAGKIPKGFEADNRVFFGEHLTRNNGGPVAIAEAEKTAVLGSIVFPEFIWLASGSKQFLKVNKLHRLGPRKILLYPDADGFAEWSETASVGRVTGVDVTISALIENRGTEDEKARQFDLADYIVREQGKIMPITNTLETTTPRST
jgi:hypothetical protein